MSEPQTDPRRYLAYHEAGHHVARFLLGCPLGPVSIRPGEHYAGISLGNEAAIPDRYLAKIGWPVVRLPAELRRYVERAVMVALVGRMAEALVRPPETGYVALPRDELQAERLARLATLGVREAKRLAEADHELAPDEQRARELVWALAGDVDEGAAYLNWLRAATVSLVRAGEFGRLVEALVPVLLEHEVVSGRLARQVLREARERR
jgi:hypothetical protein